jgi:hypothetical protein
MRRSGDMRRSGGESLICVLKFALHCEVALALRADQHI